MPTGTKLRLIRVTQKAADEAKQKKHEEEAAFLEGRLWEFTELNDESNLITLDEAKQVRTCACCECVCVCVCACVCVRVRADVCTST